MANNFADDPNCVALWRCENGALWTDSIGTNTLTASPTAPTADTTDYREGGASMYFSQGTQRYAARGDSNLSANFSLKSSYASTVRLSVCFWFYDELLPAETTYGDYLLSKWDRFAVFSNKSWAMHLRYDGTDVHLRMLKGYNSGASQEATELSTAIEANTWYHVGVTYDDSDKSVRIRLYNATTEEVTEVTATQSNAISLRTVMWLLNCQNYGAEDGIKGNLDEVVVFDDILTAAEIDQIRSGTYGWPAKAANPDPADDATEVPVGATFSWDAAALADTYDVYLGTDPGSLTLVSDGQAGTTYDPGTLDGETEYFWRIDSVNEYGTTTGDLWSFTTGKAMQRNMLLGFHF